MLSCRAFLLMATTYLTVVAALDFFVFRKQHIKLLLWNFSAYRLMKRVSTAYNLKRH
jgi:hypothetical protein